MDSGIEQSYTWYAVFAVRNDDGSVSLKFTPFIRVLSDSDGVITFSHHDEPTHPQNYAFKSNVYTNSQFVVLVDGAPNNKKAGMVRTVVHNTDRSFTYDGPALDLSQGAFLMLSPAGYNSYKYIGCFWNDSSANVLNFFKSGRNYQSLGRTLLKKGIATTPVRIDNGGYVAPTAITILYSATTLSDMNVSPGSLYGFQLGADSAHYAFRPLQTAQSNTNLQQSFTLQGEVNLHYGLFTWYKGIGKAFSSLSLQIYGWVE